MVYPPPFLSFRRVVRVPWTLALGLDLVPLGGRLTFQWREPEDRTEADRADFERLAADIRRRGILAPLIAWTHPDTGRDHVLIGQRRAYIAARLPLPAVHCLLIEDDLRREPDAYRIEQLAAMAGQHHY